MSRHFFVVHAEELPTILKERALPIEIEGLNSNPLIVGLKNFVPRFDYQDRDTIPNPLKHFFSSYMANP